MKGMRAVAALAVAFPFFYFSPWVELVSVDQPAHVGPGSTFVATVEGVAHLRDGPWPPLEAEIPPLDDAPAGGDPVSLRLGVLVPEGWSVGSVEYSVDDGRPVPLAPTRRGSLGPAPDEAWVYETYHPAPPGYVWRPFGGVEESVAWGARVRFEAAISAGAKDGLYTIVYGTWSHPPYWYLDEGGGTADEDPPPPGDILIPVPPPGDSLIPVPPPTFVEADITVGEVGPAPRVTAIQPPDGAADVPVDTDIRVTFDRDMDLSSLRDGGIQVFGGPVYYVTRGSAGAGGGPAWSPATPLDPLYVMPPWEPWPLPVEIFWNAATRTAVVEPLAPLAGRTVHTVLVTYRARAVDGVPVDTSRAASFLTVRTPAPPFYPDVPEGHRFRQAIETLSDGGVIGGFPDGTFRPDDPVTRGQLATMLVRLLGLHTPEPDGPPPFTDLPAPAEDVGADYISEAARAGIAAGFDDGTFRPHDPVKRIQMTRMIVRAAQIYMSAPPPDYSAGFADVDPADQGFVNWAAYNDLADGKAPGRFDPWGTATRGHAARLLYGVWNLVPRPLPLDAGSAP